MNEKKIILENIDYNTLDVLPTQHAIIGKDNKYIWLDSTVIPLIGYKSLDQAVGITDFDIKTPAAEFAQIFINQNQEVIRDKQKKEYITCCYYQDNSPMFFLVTKCPAYNKNEELNAVVIIVQHISNSQLQQLRHCLSGAPRKKRAHTKGQFVFELSHTFKGDISLSERQIEILSLLIRGKTISNIASILQLSPRTVEDYTSVIKDKFYCSSKSELIEKAIDRGYWTVLPKRFIDTPTIII
ncbi:MAG: response regulator transcription factor [Gammaproteobacteria bacterium]